MNAPATILILLFAGLLPASAAAVCDCSEPKNVVSGEPILEFWGRAGLPKTFAGRKRLEFTVYERVVVPRKEARRSSFSIQFEKRCAPKIEPGSLAWVRAYACDPRGGYCTSECAGTRQLARVPREGERYQGVAALSGEVHARFNEQARAAVQRCAGDDESALETWVIHRADGDDPLIVETTDGPQPDCMTEVMFRELVDVDDAIAVSGTRGLNFAAADVWSCDAAPWTCQSYYDAALAKLLEVAVPPTEEQTRQIAAGRTRSEEGDPSIEIAGMLCRYDGLNAANEYAQEHKLVGGARWEAALERMMFDCALSLGDFEAATTHSGGFGQPELAQALLSWGGPRGTKLPLRGGSPFAEALNLADGDARPIWWRQLLVRFDGWAHEPRWLEFFAETILSDPRAPAKLKPLAAVAFHKAAMLAPKHRDAYLAMGRDIVPDADIQSSLTKLEYAFPEQRAANAARAKASNESADSPAAEEAAPPVAPDEAAPETDDFDPSKITPWLITAALALLAFMIVRRIKPS